MIKTWWRKEKSKKNIRRNWAIKYSEIHLEKRHATDVPRHAGIVNLFRPQIQAANKSILDIYAENYTCVSG